MNINARLLIGLACVSLGLTACKDDYFDPEAYDARIMKSFPVDNVDPDHNWAVYGSATANISVNGDYGETYRIAIYQENPFITSPVTLLASDNVKTGQTTTLQFSYQLAQPNIFVACFDRDNRRVVKGATVGEDGTLSINFFGEDTSGSRATRGWNMPGNFSKSNSRTTRDGGNSVDFPGGSWNIGNGGGATVTISDEARALLKEGNYLGAEVTRKTDATWYNTWTIYFRAGWNGTFTAPEMSVPEGGKHIYEIQLSASDAADISANGLMLLGNNVIASRVYISDYSQAGNNNPGGGNTSDDTPFEPTYEPGSFSFDEDATSKQSSSDYSAYIKQRETKKTLNDYFLNPSQLTAYTVDLANIGSDYKTLSDDLDKNDVRNDNGRDKHWWVVPENTTVTKDFEFNADQSQLNKAVVYVRGKLNLQSYPSAGVTYIVGNGGEIAMNNDVTLSPAAHIIVLQGGKLTLAQGKTLTLGLNGISRGLYNDGTIDIQGTLAMGDHEGSLLFNDANGKVTINNMPSTRSVYNYGELAVNTMTLKTKTSRDFNYTFYNEGKCYVKNGTLEHAVNYGILNGETLNITDNYYYNAGVSEFTLLNVKTILNFGKLTAETNSSQNDKQCVNACYLHYTQGMTSATSFKTLTMLRNSYIRVDGDLYIQDAGNSMEDKSLIDIRGSFRMPESANVNAYIDGPTRSGEFAIIKIAKNINITKWSELVPTGNIYFDWAKKSQANNNGVVTFEIYDTSIGGGAHNANVMALLAQMKNFIEESSAPANFTIPDGDCTGDGYTPGNGGNTFPETPPKYRFCFEDNFPSPGDYDVNDCVITLTPVIDPESKTVKLTFTLDATGATKQIAAALRMKDFDRTKITGYSLSADSYHDPVNTGTAQGYPTLINSTQMVGDGVYLVNPVALGSSYDESSNTWLNSDIAMSGKGFCLSLFNNAHAALWKSARDGGDVDLSTLYYFYNTVDPDLDHYMKRTAAPVKMEYTFTFANADDMAPFRDIANYDLFIVEKSSGRFWEVHTYPFKFDQVLKEWAGDGVNATNTETKLGNFTGLHNSKHIPWAFVVEGDFRYPFEWQSISGESLNNQDDTFGGSTSAYPDFAGWVQNHNNNTEWYKNPNVDRVYPLNNTGN